MSTTFNIGGIHFKRTYGSDIVKIPTLTTGLINIPVVAYCREGRYFDVDFDFTSEITAPLEDVSFTTGLVDEKTSLWTTNGLSASIVMPQPSVDSFSRNVSALSSPIRTIYYKNFTVTGIPGDAKANFVIQIQGSTASTPITRLSDTIDHEFRITEGTVGNAVTKSAVITNSSASGYARFGTDQPFYYGFYFTPQIDMGFTLAYNTSTGRWTIPIQINKVVGEENCHLIQKEFILSDTQFSDELEWV